MTTVIFPELGYFLANFDALATECGDDWLAIKGAKVVAHARTVTQLREEVDRLGCHCPFVTKATWEAWRATKAVADGLRKEAK